MHRDSGSPSNGLALRGICSPMDAALAAILLQPAIPLAPYDFDPIVIAATRLRTIVSTPAFVPGSPDPRPPRI
jgi:hypothetical protein